MKDKHVNPLLKSVGLLSVCISGLNVSLSATRSVKKKTKTYKCGFLSRPLGDKFSDGEEMGDFS